VNQVAEQVATWQLAGEFLQPVRAAHVHHLGFAIRAIQMKGVESTFRHLEGDGCEQLLNGDIPPIEGQEHELPGLISNASVGVEVG